MHKQDIIKKEILLVTWKDVRNEVAKVNNELASFIDNINPDETHKFVKVTYFYGDEFVKNGQTFLPGQDNSTLVEITHPSIDRNVQQELTYSPIPLFLSLDKSTESFFDTGRRTIPINILKKGNLIGLYQEIDHRTGIKSPGFESFCAGACSTFMLPKITDKSNLKKLLSAFNIPLRIEITKLADHFELFKHIAQSTEICNKWHSTVLFFGKSFIRRKFESPEGATFRNYLFNKAWGLTRLAINQRVFNMFWETYASIILSRKIQPPIYILDQVKHLLSMMIGNFPGFVVAGDNEEIAPISILQAAFIEHYSLKEYLPTIMCPDMLTTSDKKTPYVYYSLAHPTVLEGTSLKENSNTLIEDLREIKMLIESLRNRLTSKHTHYFHDNIRKTNIDYFHHKSDIYHQIRASENLAREDQSFLLEIDRFKDRRFCPTSPFFGGCIRIEIEN
jgi:hypothetical protein